MTSPIRHLYHVLAMLRDGWLDLTFRLNWRRGICVCAVGCFDHNSRFPWGGPAACALGDDPTKKLPSGVIHMFTLIDLMIEARFHPCPLRCEVAQWLDDNQIVHRRPGDNRTQHCISFSKRADAALFMIMFEGVVL